MFRNVVLHMNNEQPMLADLFSLPTPTDTSLVCTNLRMMNGQRPIFADDTASVFVFPLLHLRFIEVHPGSERNGQERPVGEAPMALVPFTRHETPEPELELDEDLLRRVREA